MSFGGSSGTNTEEPRALSLRVNSSAYGVGKARIWGKCRAKSNMLWYGDFQAIPHTTTSSSGGGGKGGGSPQSTNTSYTYTAGMALGICTGVISGIGKVWRDKDITSMSALGLTLKTGALRQSAWSHLVSNYPDQAVAYSGLAYVAHNALDLGDSSSQPNLTFEVFGERLIDGGDDAYAHDVINDIVTDPLEGVGLPVTTLGSTEDYALWCQEMGLTVAVNAADQAPARDLIASLLKATLSEAIWSAGQIKIIPYGDSPVGSWSPRVEISYEIGEGDVLEPPRHKRKQPSDATNRVTLNYTSRAKDYNTNSVTRDDLTAVTRYGQRPETLDLPCIASDEMASVVCEFWRDRNLNIRNQWELDVDERFCLVEAMDFLRISFGPQGINKVVVNVVEVADDGEGKITLLVEEWPFGLMTRTAVRSQPSAGYVPEYNRAPGATASPVIFEAPYYMTDPDLQLWIAASGGPDWGGAHIWVSDNGDSYQRIGQITNPARYGRLVSDLPLYGDPDVAHTLQVDMSASHGQLYAATRSDADNGNTECWISGEVISYENAELVSTDRYDLTYLRRGRQGTEISAHAAGAKFVRLNDALFKYRVPRERIGTTIWIKLQSFNKVGRGAEDLDTVVPYVHTISDSKPTSPDAVPWFLISGDVLTWGGVTNIIQPGYEIRWQSGQNRAWETAEPLHTGVLVSSPYKMVNPPSGQITLMIRAVDSYGNYSEISAVILTELGDSLVTNVIETVSAHALAWPGEITGGTVEVGSGDLVANETSAFFGNDLAPFYPEDGNRRMYPASTYSAMTWTSGFIVPPEMPLNSTMQVQTNLAGASVKAEYRRENTSPLYGFDQSVPFYGAAADPMFPQPMAWSTFPADGLFADTVPVQFRLSADKGSVQARYSQFDVIFDAPDIYETFDDIVIPSTGLRLPISKAYRAIKNVQLTLQADGGNAFTLKVIDKDAILGPLVMGYTVAGVATSAKTDASIQGY